MAVVVICVGGGVGGGVRPIQRAAVSVTAGQRLCPPDRLETKMSLVGESSPLR